MIIWDFRSSPYIKKGHKLNALCFVLIMLLTMPLLVGAKEGNIAGNTFQEFKNWVESTYIAKYVSNFLAAKGGTIHVALLEGNEQIIKPRQSVYFGFFSGNNNSYEVELTGGNNCSPPVSSSPQKLPHEKEDLFYHSVVFDQCQFVAGSYRIKIGSSIVNEFTIKNEGCSEERASKGLSPEEKAYYLARENSPECVFEAYQIVAERKSSQKFAQMLVLGSSGRIPPQNK